MAGHITCYDKMPIPPIEAHTSYFDAGVVRIGVEHRILTDELVAQIRASLLGASGDQPGQLEELDDSGVSLHVFGYENGIWREHIRFDCFQEDPHYHYVNWSILRNEVLRVDPVADGDPMAWALDRIRNRLPQMLNRAGADYVANSFQVSLLENVFPNIAEAAYRARLGKHQS